MDKELKGKIAGGMKWAGIESFAGKFLSIVTGIIIARQLMPSDYGLIGMLAIFIAISNTFLNSGISSALIQKKNASQADFSTGFFLNVCVGVVIYTSFYFVAPLIAAYYRQPILVRVARITTITLLINSLCIVQNARLSINLDFRARAIISLSSQVLSGILGIVMAYTGYGVWALVYPGICGGILNLLLLWYHNKWLPSITFKKKSFKALFDFGSKHLLASLIYDVYANFSTFVIGRLYRSADLGYYTRASQFASIPNGTILGIIIKVNYPVLAKFQDDNEKLLSVYSTLLKAPLFILYPLLFGLASLSYPMIDVLLGQKWTPAAGMLSVLCFGELWTPLILINTNLLYVKGRTDIVLKLELIKRPLAIAMILLAIPTGLYGICIASVLFCLVSFFIDTYYTGVILNYGSWKQLKEVLPILCYSIIMAVTIILSTWWIPYSWLKLTVGIPVGIISYLLYAHINKDVTLYSLILNLVEKYPRFQWILNLYKNNKIIKL